LQPHQLPSFFPLPSNLAHSPPQSPLSRVPVPIQQTQPSPPSLRPSLRPSPSPSSRPNIPSQVNVHTAAPRATHNHTAFTTQTSRIPTSYLDTNIYPALPLLTIRIDRPLLCARRWPLARLPLAYAPQSRTTYLRLARTSPPPNSSLVVTKHSCMIKSSTNPLPTPQPNKYSNAPIQSQRIRTHYVTINLHFDMMAQSISVQSGTTEETT